MNAFTTTTIDLTLRAPAAETGKPVLLEGLPGGFAAGDRLTASLYEITGADGTKRTLSMAGLVMVLCLSRATELERGIIEIMETMERTSARLERLTRIEEEFINSTSSSPVADDEGVMTSDRFDELKSLGYDIENYPSVGKLYDAIYNNWKYLLPGDANYTELNDWLNALSSIDRDDDPLDLLSDKAFLEYMGVTPQDISTIESKMDSLNSFSQETMLELQSQTNKRDQSYDMVANILKSLGGVLTGIANNL